MDSYEGLNKHQILKGLTTNGNCKDLTENL